MARTEGKLSSVTTAAPFYRDAETLKAEVAKHGGNFTACASAHGISQSTISKWWAKYAAQGLLPPHDRTPGLKATAGATARPTPGAEVTREELLDQEVKELRAQIKVARKLEVFDAKSLYVLERNVAALDGGLPLYKPTPVAVDKALTTHTHVLQYSDLHAAEVVSYEAMNGLNEYNWEIMDQRHGRLARAIRSFKRNRPYPIDDLYIWGLGDMVTGDIHDELRETNEIVISEAATKLGYYMADFIASELVPLYKNIYIDAVVGNHGRVSKKPEFKSATKNWDWIAYKIMELRLAEFTQVKVNLPTSFETVVQVYDWNTLLFHGDGVPTNMPGVPWGGITRRTKEQSATYAAMGIHLDHFACGHYHEANVTAQKRILMNGSLKGPDEYGLKRYGGGQPACQLLHTFHPTRGLVSTDFLVVQ